MKCPQCLLENPPDSSFCRKCGSVMAAAPEDLKTSTLTYNIEVKELAQESLFAGRYRIIQKLGHGGMGVVYQAEDTKLKRTVALKLIRPEFTIDREAKKRFILEAQLAASLDHPNICTVFEISESEGQDFITMAYIDGQTLDEMVESGPLGPGPAVDIGIQVAQGLNEAHEKGIVHRDIKSANIMLTRRDQAKIMDFGLAKLTEGPGVTKTTKIVGTVAYMSPEQAKGEKIDARSDIWSLGVVLYEMLTGLLPFRKDSTAGVLYCIVNENPRPVWQNHPDFPLKLGAVVDKCLEKNPAKRYQKAAELAGDLESVKQDLLAKRKGWRIPFLAARAGKRLRKILVPAAAAILVLLPLLLPSVRSKISDWAGLKSAPVKTTEAAQPVAPPAEAVKPPTAPEVEETADAERVGTINVGANDRVEAGQTGQVYYAKRTASEETKVVVAQFIVKEVLPDESRIEIAEKTEVIKPGYLIAFDDRPRGALFVDTDPSGAVLFLDDVNKGITGARLILNPGIYGLRIKAKNYQEVVEMITVSPGVIIKKPYRLTPLRPQSGTLMIESTPSGAGVFLGREERPSGTTPFEKVMPPARYSGVIRMPNCEDMPFEIDVRAGDIAYKNYQLVPRTGTLIITSTPADAQVYLDDSEIACGSTPLTKTLPPKEYTVRIKKEGYQEARDTVALGAAQSVPKSYQLTPLVQAPPSTYTLVVNTTPGNARVAVNDGDEILSPTTVTLKEPNVVLKIRKENYKPFQKAFSMSTSPHVENITLEPIGTATLLITADPPAAVEIDGRLLFESVPPQKIVSVPEGERTVTFIFEEYGAFDKKISVRDGDKVPVNLKFEPWMLEQKGLYGVTAFSRNLPPVQLKIDGRTVGDGRVPPARRRWVSEGRHKIELALSDRVSEFADVELDDFIKSGARKKINVQVEANSLTDLSGTDLPGDLSNSPNSDWISFKSSLSAELEVNGVSHGGPTLASGFLEDTAGQHRLKIKVGNPVADANMEIGILKIAKKTLYKIIITLGTPKPNQGGATCP